ncbi:MAG: DNA polymerase III subunit delta [Defluviitaleaceae bacterium]|nr:DNA polymerase III subunit delta [Defluviitaleaceae bacterium]MCL2836131.1 DNA polymerase III subunit delta [Defluviitaleaceae bacterium]
MKELNARLKSGKLDRIYVFYGPETYLIRAYEKRLAAAVFGGGETDINTAVFEGESHSPHDIIAAAETLPFLAEYRLIVLKNTGFLQTGKKDAADRLSAYLPGAPETTVFLFVETVKPPDKRGKLFKMVSTAGFAAEFTTPSEPELAAWLVKLLASEGVSVKTSVAAALIRYVGVNGDNIGIMESLHTEALKLASYKGQGSAIDIDDIEQLCTQSIEGKIFALVKEIGTKNLKALTSLANLIALKEAPLMILSMIARQFRLMIICKGLRDKGISPAEIAKTAGLRDFMVSDFLRQSANFSEKTLAAALADILEAEVNIKTGKTTDRLAVETLIIKLCG